MWKESKLTLGLAMLVALGSSGCGDLTAGGAGEAEVSVRGDDEPSSAMLQQSDPSATLASTQAPTDSNGASIEGTVGVTLQVFVVPPAGGDPIDISGGLREIVVDADGRAAVELGSVELSPNTYAGILVRFTRVEANITSSIGVDLPFVGTVIVDFGNQDTLEVERVTPFQLREGAKVLVEVNLHTGTWLRAAGPALPVVTAAQFRNAVEIAVEANGG